MRVFVLGIDGLTMRIMGPLMERGLIPNFKHIYDKGAKSKLKSTIPPLTPPGWASIYTGKNPGKHGLFEFKRRKGYAFETNTCWDYDEAPPVWKYLADHGKKCILLNVPMYYPPLQIENCYSVSGFDAIEDLNIFHPPSLRQEIFAKAPGYKVDSHWQHDLPEGQEEAYLKANIRVTEARIEALKYLMKEKKWDFFFSVFTGTDRMQHFFWDDIVQGKSEVVRYYKLLDEAIGHVMRSLQKDDFFFVVSDHGFCQIERGVNVNRVLQQEGLISINKTVELPIDYRKLRRLMERLGVSEKLKAILPRAFINKLQEHTRVKGVFSSSRVNWADTKAFASSGLFGGISINLKNREPSGIVPESEYEAVRKKIIHAFSSLTDNERKGRKVIKNIYKREDIYSGKHLSEMPDLILIAETGYRFDETADGGDIFREPKAGPSGHILKGEHEIDSLFMFHHDGFNKVFDELSVTDIAPSVLNLFEVPIPASMDGKSFVEGFKPAVYLDELTGTVYGKKKSSLKIKSKLKNLEI